MLPIMTFEHEARMPALRYIFDVQRALPYESVVTLLHKFALFNGIPGHILVARYAPHIDPFEGVPVSSRLGRRIVRDLHLSRERSWQACFHLDTPEWNQLRYCSACLSQRFHSVVHQRAALRHCPIHNWPLRDDCPRCGGHVDLRLCMHLIEHPWHCNHCGASLCTPLPIRSPMTSMRQKHYPRLARALS